MSYNLLEPFKFISAHAMNASFTSDPQEIKLQDNIGIQLDWTGTPTGTWAFQISADFKKDINGNILNAGHWISLPLSPAIVAAGAADDAYVDFNQLSAAYIRVVYTAVSGSGTVNGYIVAKGV